MITTSFKNLVCDVWALKELRYDHLSDVIPSHTLSSVEFFW